MSMVPTEQARVFVHLLPSLIPPGSLRGGVAVVVDVLRATTVMVQALAAGCEAVIPCGEIDEAKAVAAGLAAGHGLARRRAPGLADPGIRPGQLAGRLHSGSLPGQDAGDDHDQRHPCDPGQPRGRAGLHRQLRQPAGDFRRDLGPVPQERPRPPGPHHLRGNRGPHQPGGQLAGRCPDEPDRRMSSDLVPGSEIAPLFGNDEALMVVSQWLEVERFLEKRPLW